MFQFIHFTCQWRRHLPGQTGIRSQLIRWHSPGGTKTTRTSLSYKWGWGNATPCQSIAMDWPDPVKYCRCESRACASKQIADPKLDITRVVSEGRDPLPRTSVTVTATTACMLSLFTSRAVQHMCRWMRGRAQKWCCIGITILPVVGETNELLPQHPSRSRTEESSFVHNPIHLSLEMSSAIHTSAI